MRKVLIVICLVFLVTFSLQAQATYPWAQYAAGFQAFAEGAASALPTVAAVGLNWSPAYIGQFPHFGVGATVGFGTIPYAAMEDIFGLMNVSIPSDYKFLETMGIPFPAAVIDARLGGFAFPFDLGFKLGYIPDSARALLSFDLDYLMIGGDFRLSLIKEKGIIPAVSVGVGYTYMRGRVLLPDIIGEQVINLTSTLGVPYYLKTTAPDVDFNWHTHTFELKAQASKRILILTPNIGFGAAYGISGAGGGLSADVLYSTDGTNYFPLTSAQIQYLENLFAAAGQSMPNLSSTAILVDGSANGWSFRVFGGLSINLLILWIDLNGSYNFVSGSYGASANVRIQL